MTSAAVTTPIELSAPTLNPGDNSNPWVSDQVLFSMSVWWVRVDKPDAENFTAEVGHVFMQLQEDLQSR